MSDNYPKNQAEIDDLLANPFDMGEDSDLGSHSASYESSFLDELSKAETQAQQTYTSENIYDRLPDHRKKQAEDLAKQIDETNMAAVIAYGANAQKKLGDFSSNFLANVQIKDTGEIGDTLTDLMTQLESTKPRDLTAETNVFRRLLGKAKRSVSETQMAYQKIGNQLDKIAIKLDREKNQLLNDNVMLDQLYDKNEAYFEALNIYIAAGELKMQQLQGEIIPRAIEEARESKNQMKVQEVHDLNQFLDRLDKRIHDLRLTRQMTIQQAPQIRLIQNTNQTLAEKIQVSIHTAIPLWENQVTIALAILRQQDAALTQRQVSETTNNLMRRNSEMLKQSTIDTQREAERGIIDIETLQVTQANLVETLEETLELQREGRRQRQAAQAELESMENELHDKLLEISQEQKKWKQED